MIWESAHSITEVRKKQERNFSKLIQRGVRERASDRECSSVLQGVQQEYAKKQDNVKKACRENPCRRNPNRATNTIRLISCRDCLSQESFCISAA